MPVFPSGASLTGAVCDQEATKANWCWVADCGSKASSDLVLWCQIHALEHLWGDRKAALGADLLESRHSRTTIAIDLMVGEIVLFGVAMQSGHFEGVWYALLVS